MNTTFVEKNCVVEFQGRKFEAGGAVVTENYLVAYPDKNGRLNDWRGNQIGTWRVISSRPAVFFGYRSCFSSRYFYMRATVNGVVYSLRGFGEGMVAKGRKIRA